MFNKLFRNQKQREQFIADLETANGNLKNGWLSLTEIEDAFTNAIADYNLLVKDFDSELRITVTPIMQKVARSYKYNRERVVCEFTFKKGKILGWKFRRAATFVNGYNHCIKIGATTRLHEEIINRKTQKDFYTINPQQTQE